RPVQLDVRGAVFHASGDDLHELAAPVRAVAGGIGLGVAPVHRVYRLQARGVGALAIKGDDRLGRRLRRELDNAAGTGRSLGRGGRTLQFGPGIDDRVRGRIGGCWRRRGRSGGGRRGSRSAGRSGRCSRGFIGGRDRLGRLVFAASGQNHGRQTGGGRKSTLHPLGRP